MDINAKDHRGLTALHWACMTNSCQSLHFLMAFGADLSAQCSKGMNPLHYAVQKAKKTKNEYLIVKLIMKGTDRGARDKQDRRPIDLLDFRNEDALEAARDN
jgi:ankyrin repeat protein